MNALDPKLWKIFSEYIRRRDALEYSGGDIAKCCTCSHVAHWKEMDCGHFISRRHLATKFDEKNNGIQCKGCNGFGSGKQFEYSIFLDNKHGKGTAEMLLAKSRNACKWGKFEYNLLIDEYKKKVKELQKVT